MMEPFPDKYLPHTVTLQRLTGYSDDGTPTFAAAVTYSARVVHRDRSIMTATGQLVHERGFVLIQGAETDRAPAVSTDDKLTLPDGETPPLMETAQVIDAEGVRHHTKISFG